MVQKKISGIKRHFCVDILGLPHGISVTPANTSERDGAIEMFKSFLSSLEKVEKFLFDGGYRGDKFKNEVETLFPKSKVEVVLRKEEGSFKLLPQRWIVERSFAWIEKSRRLWKNCERLIETSTAWIYLAFSSIILKRMHNIHCG